MRRFEITDIKTFAAHLLAKETFDKFHLHRAVFETAYRTEIDGRQNAEFYKTDGAAPDSETVPEFVPWSRIRPIAYQLIKGDRLPLSFRIQFVTNRETGAYYVKKSGLTGAGITSLSLNVLYQNGELSLTSGVSYDGFTLDKSAEKLWETDVAAFLLKNGIPYRDAED